MRGSSWVSTAKPGVRGVENLGSHSSKGVPDAFGEIDVIANDRGTVVFVEVKTKTDSSFSDPVESVTKQKQRRLVSMAEQYAAYHSLDRTPCRFDVVAVDVSVAPPKITLYKDAFRPGGTTEFAATRSTAARCESS